MELPTQELNQLARNGGGHEDAVAQAVAWFETAGYQSTAGSVDIYILASALPA